MSFRRLLQTNERMFHVYSRRQNCRNAPANNYWLSATRFRQFTPIYGGAYNGVGALGFQHFAVNHSLNYVDPVTGSRRQNIERSWKSAKERNKRQNGTHRPMLDSYFCQWMWRQRKRNVDLFDQILLAIAAYWPTNIKGISLNK